MKVCVVGAGPSIHDTVDKLKELIASGAKVAAINHAHDWVVEQGIKPDIALLMESSHIYRIKKAVPECKYIIRSDAIPEVKKTVEEGQVETYRRDEAHSITVRGMGALNLLYRRGFREFHFFGFDACSFGDQTHFDGAHKRSAHQPRYFAIDGVVYKSNKIWRHQVFALLQLLTGPHANEVKVTFYGDGLLAAVTRMIRNKQQPPDEAPTDTGAFLRDGIEVWYSVKGDKYSIHTRPATEAEAKQYSHGIRKGKAA